MLSLSRSGLWNGKGGSGSSTLEEPQLMRRESTMKTTKNISDERLKEIVAIVPTVDEEAPEITSEQAARARLAHGSHPEWYRVTPVKQQICIKIDKDVLDALKAEGKGYQTRINKILREAVLGA